jgi:hypothetical protein
MSRVARTPAPRGVTSTTVVPGIVRTSKVCSLSVSVSDTAGSSRGSSRSARCTIVTTAPNMADNSPSSHPAGPPPTTTSDSGSSSVLSRSSLVHGTTEDSPVIGGRTGTDPVASTRSR